MHLISQFLPEPAPPTHTHTLPAGGGDSTHSTANAPRDKGERAVSIAPSLPPRAEALHLSSQLSACQGLLAAAQQQGVRVQSGTRPGHTCCKRGCSTDGRAGPAPPPEEGVVVTQGRGRQARGRARRGGGAGWGPPGSVLGGGEHAVRGTEWPPGGHRRDVGGGDGGRGNWEAARVGHGGGRGPPELTLLSPLSPCLLCPGPSQALGKGCLRAWRGERALRNF